MFIHPKRILMAEADGATGAAAPVAPTAEPTVEPQAPVASGLTRDDVKSMLSEFRNGLFADFRKAGGFEKSSKPVKGDEPQASVTMSAAEERTFLRGVDRAISQLGFEPTAQQYARLERDVLADKPSDVSAYVKDYFPALKGSPTPAAPAAPQAPAAKPAPLNEQPASDRGGTAAVVPLVERDLVTMSESDRRALIKEKGVAWYRSQLASQLKGRPVTLR